MRLSSWASGNEGGAGVFWAVAIRVNTSVRVSVNNMVRSRRMGGRFLRKRISVSLMEEVAADCADGEENLTAETPTPTSQHRASTPSREHRACRGPGLAGDPGRGGAEKNGED